MSVHFVEKLRRKFGIAIKNNVKRGEEFRKRRKRIKSGGKIILVRFDQDKKIKKKNKKKSEKPTWRCFVAVRRF